MTESKFELIQQATQMLRDHSVYEQKLIYEIAKMDNEGRMAIAIAYERILYGDSA